MRRDPAPSPGELMEVQLREEIRGAAKEAMAELLRSEGWQRVLQPALLARMQRIARQLATSSAGIEEIREKQGEYKALAWLVGLTVDDMHQLLEE